MDWNLLTEAELKDIYTQYYKDILEDDFWKIVKTDPTYNPQKEQKMGKYGKWLLNLYRQKKLKLEDLYKAADYLSYFNKYINKIEQKDINKYGDLPSLLNVIQPFKNAQENGNELATSKSDEIRKIKEDAEKFYEDDTWLVIIPHSQEAACYYGKNTEWCTAATTSYNMFNDYYSRGMLYININKRTNKKYQFHFEDLQFMDENDRPIPNPIVSNIPITEGLLTKYIQKYGGRATIALTKSLDQDLKAEEVIVGDEPYYSYIDYDGYCPIVKSEGLKLVDISPDELSVSNDVEYLGNGIFKYTISKDTDVYYEDEDEVYEEEEEIKVIFNAKTKQSMEGDFSGVFHINWDYMQLTDKSDNTKKLIDTNTFQIVGTVPYGAIIRAPQDFFRGGHHGPFAEYDSNIVVISRYLRTADEIEKEGFGRDTIYRVYDLRSKQYIIPHIFTHDPYGYRLNTLQLEDGKYYMIYQGYINNNRYDATRAYVIVNTDGSLSEVLTEGLNDNKLVENHKPLNKIKITEKKFFDMIYEAVIDYMGKIDF